MDASWCNGSKVIASCKYVDGTGFNGEFIMAGSTSVGEADSAANILSGIGGCVDGHDTCMVVAAKGTFRTMMT